jgi:murein L,D-transpeptidase YafK
VILRVLPVVAACGACAMPEVDRVSAATKRVSANLTERAKEIGVKLPGSRVFIRAFKQERELEVWVSGSSKAKYKLLKTYQVAAASGVLGPKRVQGDRQVPEGVYHIDRFNPKSRFHLSLGINYPNAADRVHADQERPGGDIFIHGDQLSIGCLAMTDEKIEEIYVIASGATTRIPVHIFPFRMTPQNLKANAKSEWATFWKTLEPIYSAFEREQRVPRVTIKNGQYHLGSEDS